MSVQPIWKPVAGLIGLYEVSDRGQVRSLWQSGHGYDRPRTEPLVLRPQALRNGYVYVKVGRRKRSIHRLVLEAFVGPCPEGCEAAHLNGLRGDNRAENLAWKTPTLNYQDKVAHGTAPIGDHAPARLHPATVARGERHGSRTHPERLKRGEAQHLAKLTAALVTEIRRAWTGGESMTSLAKRYDVNRRTIANVCSGETWRHVPFPRWPELPEQVRAADQPAVRR